MDENTKKRIIYRCKHRGNKEMDIVLTDFVDNKINRLPPSEYALFEEFLEEYDGDLYNWIAGIENPPEKYSAIVGMIKA